MIKLTTPVNHTGHRPLGAQGFRFRHGAGKRAARASPRLATAYLTPHSIADCDDRRLTPHTPRGSNRHDGALLSSNSQDAPLSLEQSVPVGVSAVHRDRWKILRRNETPIHSAEWRKRGARPSGAVHRYGAVVCCTGSQDDGRTSVYCREWTPCRARGTGAALLCSVRSCTGLSQLSQLLKC